MYILAIKKPDGTIGDIKVFDTLPDLKDSVNQSATDEIGVGFTGDNICITSSKKEGHFVVFEEWSIARLFEAAAQNFEVSSAG
jgi:hypothetical protein